MRSLGIILAGCLAACGGRAAETGSVRSGLEVLLSDSIHLVAGRRVGLITNHTAVARDGTHAIDLLAGRPELELVALFGPEHGLRGRVEAGRAVASARDSATGLPIHSLYGETRKPTAAMLAGVQILVFDIQDIGARYYTYVSTMALAMEAAAEAGIPFVVLDRPNPIGGALVQGNVLDPAFATFVGMYPVPMRHGMTAGELARLFNVEFGIGVQLHVVPMHGWRRGMWFDATGLPWTPPSPNMPSLASATHYPGTCLLEGTNLSVGRGAALPFQQIGAPWLDGAALAARLNSYELPGVRFEVTTFTPHDPSDGKFDGEVVHGVRLIGTGREQYDPTVAAVAALLEARRMAGSRWAWNEAHFDRLAGTGRLREAIETGRPLEEIVAPWPAERIRFAARRQPYLLYPSD